MSISTSPVPTETSEAITDFLFIGKEEKELSVYDLVIVCGNEQTDETCADLIKLMDPKYIEVWGRFLPRGGISIDPYCNYGKPGTRWEDVAWERLSHHDLYPEKVDNR